YAKAGVMLRGSSDPSSVNVILDVRPTGDIEFMARTSTGVQTTFIAGNFGPAPIWLRLKRTGQQVDAPVSLDGGVWTGFASSSLSALPSTVEAGLAVTSHDTSTLNT